MRGKKIMAFMLLIAALLLTGCSFRTVDQLYSPPMRSDAYYNLQSAINEAMLDLEYCAPLTGEHQQTVQMADLDGDGKQEYLVFTKGSDQNPLRILCFYERNGEYIHTDTVESNGTAFDQVEYVQIDGQPGVEIVVGRQLSGQVLRAVSVYTFANGEAEQLLATNCTKFLTVDLDLDGYSELFVLRPGQTDTDNGIAAIYGMESGTMERSNEVNMSAPADKLKRIIVGKLHDVPAAVYIASAVDETSLITDAYAYVDGVFTNVTFSNESGTSVHTMRNYYVYADDIDNDGIVELPNFITMVPIEKNASTESHNLIRWYAMTSTGNEVDKVYTYHNFIGGWYLELNSIWAERVSVVQNGNQYEFYIWDRYYQNSEKIMVLSVLTGKNREEQAREEDRVVLLKTDGAVYTAQLERNAAKYGLTQEKVLQSFHQIQQDWKTGEI